MHASVTLQKTKDSESKLAQLKRSNAAHESGTNASRVVGRALRHLIETSHTHTERTTRPQNASELHRCASLHTDYVYGDYYKSKLPTDSGTVSWAKHDDESLYYG